MCINESRLADNRKRLQDFKDSLPPLEERREKTKAIFEDIAKRREQYKIEMAEVNEKRKEYQGIGLYEVDVSLYSGENNTVVVATSLLEAEEKACKEFEDAGEGVYSAISYRLDEVDGYKIHLVKE